MQGAIAVALRTELAGRVHGICFRQPQLEARGKDRCYDNPDQRGALGFGPPRRGQHADPPPLSPRQTQTALFS